MHNGYGIAFDGKGSWNFDNDSARNIQENYFLVLGEGPTFGNNGNFCASEKRFNINSSKVKTKFCLSFYYNGIIVIYL